MIDEDVLRRLLHDAAESAPAPGRAPEALLASIADRSITTARRRRRPGGRTILATAAALAVLVVGLGAFIDRSDSPPPVSFSRDTLLPHDEGATATTTALPPTVIAGAAAAGSAGGGATSRGEADSADSAVGTGTGGATASGSAAQQGTPAPALPAGPVDTARVIKTGSVDLEVPERGFEPTVERITSMAVGLGGYVAESTTTESGDAPHGSITLRIPASSFDQLVLEVRKLGEVKAVTAKGTDVTAQFSDLAARLSALSATRDRLFEVLRGARNVGDIIAVQDRITGVQTEIEQIQGQQRLLEDQTSFGTLAITLGEPGAELVEIEAPPDEGLGAAWAEARRRFGDSIEGLVSWSGSAAVVLLVGLVVAVLVRLAWWRGRKHLV